MKPVDYIEAYLVKYNMNVRTFAKLCDISSHTVYKLLRGDDVSGLIAAKIEHYTREIPYDKLTSLPKKKRRWKNPLTPQH